MSEKKFGERFQDIARSFELRGLYLHYWDKRPLIYTHPLFKAAAEWYVVTLCFSYAVFKFENGYFPLGAIVLSLPLVLIIAWNKMMGDKYFSFVHDELLKAGAKEFGDELQSRILQQLIEMPSKETLLKGRLITFDKIDHWAEIYVNVDPEKVQLMHITRDIYCTTHANYYEISCNGFSGEVKVTLIIDRVRIPEFSKYSFRIKENKMSSTLTGIIREAYRIEGYLYP